jgi:hypothetical protein
VRLYCRAEPIKYCGTAFPVIGAPIEQQAAKQGLLRMTDMSGRMSPAIGESSKGLSIARSGQKIPFKHRKPISRAVVSAIIRLHLENRLDDLA